MRNRELLRLLYRVVVNGGLTLAIVAWLLSDRHYGSAQMPLPSGGVSISYGKAWTVSVNNRIRRPTRWQFRLRPTTAQLWNRPRIGRKTMEWFKEMLRKHRPPVETRTFAGITLRTSANFDSVSFSHSWVIGVFAVLALLPLIKRLRRKRTFTVD